MRLGTACLIGLVSLYHPNISDAHNLRSNDEEFITPDSSDVFGKPPSSTGTRSLSSTLSIDHHSSDRYEYEYVPDASPTVSTARKKKTKRPSKRKHHKSSRPNPSTKSNPSPSPTKSCFEPNTQLVKIQSNNGSPLKLYEVRVFASNGQNMALSQNGAVAYQSSQHGWSVASKAQDDNVETYSMTSPSDGNAWWAIALSREEYVYKVQIVVDEDSCGLEGAVMTLSDLNGDVVVATRTMGGRCGMVDEFFIPRCTLSPTTAPSKSPTARPTFSPSTSPTITCYPKVKYVMVSSVTGSFLLNEIRVYETSGYNTAPYQVSRTTLIGSQDSNNPVSKTIDQDEGTYTRTSSGDGILQLAYDGTGVKILQIELVLGDTSLYGGKLQLLDASFNSILTRTIPYERAPTFVFKDNANCPTERPTSKPISTNSPTLSPTLTCYPPVNRVRIEAASIGIQIGLFEVNVMSAGYNVAPSGSALQSSTEGEHYASSAADGDMTSFSLTKDTRRAGVAFWEVMLDGYYKVDKVVINNHWCGLTPGDDERNGNCMARLSGAKVQLIDGTTVIEERTLGFTLGKTAITLSYPENPLCNPNPPTASPTVKPSSSPTHSPTTSPTISPSITPTTSPTFTCYTNIKRVKITSTTGERISLREVEIYVGGENIASSGKTRQSSTFGPHSANNAVDKNIISYSSTNDEANAWLEIKFRKLSHITHIRIRNRYCSNLSEGKFDLCKCYLSGAVVEYIGGNGRTVVSESLGDMCNISEKCEALVSNPSCPGYSAFDSLANPC